jgi:apolipoprotein D and lipocalin family protein
MLHGARHASDRSQQALDLHRFVGHWHVIAGITADDDKKSYRPAVHYQLSGSDHVDLSLTYREGGFDGQERTVQSRINLDAGAPKTWRNAMQTLFTTTQRVLFINADYTQAVVSRGNDGVWVLCREPQMSCEDFFRCAQQVREQGYDTRRLAFMPQTDRSA